MDMMDDIKKNLELIKSIAGVENAVLTQRDGNPILSAGVWLSRDEIFSVSAATSAIYNVGLSLHGGWLKNMVIEGPKAKILIAPVSQGIDVAQDPNEYYIALTTLSKVNLGSVFIKTKTCLSNISQIIYSSNLSFKPPLREYNEMQINNILEHFQSKKTSEAEVLISSIFMGLSPDVYRKCDDVLNNFNKTVPNLIYSSISYKGGFIVTNIQPSNQFNLTPDAETAMSFSLFDTASRYAWFLKKMNISSIFLDCEHYMHFIMGFKDGIFSSYIFKENQRIGLIRLVVPKFLELIQSFLDEARHAQIHQDFGTQHPINPLLIR